MCITLSNGRIGQSVERRVLCNNGNVICNVHSRSVSRSLIGQSQRRLTRRFMFAQFLLHFHNINAIKHSSSYRLFRSILTIGFVEEFTKDPVKLKLVTTVKLNDNRTIYSRSFRQNREVFTCICFVVIVLYCRWVDSQVQLF